MESKKAAVIFNAGIGNGLCLTPLIKALKKNGFKVHGLFTSNFPLQEIWDEFDILDSSTELRSKPALATYTSTHLNYFDTIFLDYFANTSSLKLFSKAIGKSVLAIGDNNTRDKKLQQISWLPNIHEGQQNLRLFSKNSPLAIADFKIEKTAKLADQPFIICQPIAGNNAALWKTWPWDNWLSFFEMLRSSGENRPIHLIGDRNETIHDNTQFAMLNLVDCMGRINLEDLPGKIQQADLLLGLDSGPMHLAAALNTPTFTIWGATAPMLYGYSGLSDDHVIMKATPKDFVISYQNDHGLIYEKSRYDQHINCIDSLTVDKAFESFTKWQKTSGK